MFDLGLRRLNSFAVARDEATSTAASRDDIGSLPICSERTCETYRALVSPGTVEQVLFWRTGWSQRDGSEDYASLCCARALVDAVIDASLAERPSGLPPRAGQGSRPSTAISTAAIVFRILSVSQRLRGQFREPERRRPAAPGRPPKLSLQARDDRSRYGRIQREPLKAPMSLRGDPKKCGVKFGAYSAVGPGANQPSAYG